MIRLILISTDVDIEAFVKERTLYLKRLKGSLLKFLKVAWLSLNFNQAEYILLSLSNILVTPQQISTFFLIYTGIKAPY